MRSYRFAEFIAIALEALAILSALGTVLGIVLGLLSQSLFMLIAVFAGGVVWTMLLFGVSQALNLLLDIAKGTGLARR